MTFIDFFAGIGGFHSGFEKAGIKCIGWCEFDKYAQKSYQAMYNMEGLWFKDDVRKVRGWELPGAAVWTFGFPCQDVSIAGKQKGIKRGTRSGLFFEIMRLLDEAEENKPQWIIAENVKNLFSIEGGWGFFRVLSEMEARGYSIEWKVYNSKGYGVPQNRERVYIAGYLGERGGRALLPAARKSERTLKQVIKGGQADRVYDTELSCTLSSEGGGGGAKTGLYKFIRGVSKEDHHGVMLMDGNMCYIRKLTPRECWRLQGFTDDQFDKAQAVNSNSQLYKQAGNAVTVNVTYEIGKHIMAFEKDGRLK